MTRRPAYWPLTAVVVALAGVAFAVPPTEKKADAPPAHGDPKAAKPADTVAGEAAKDADRIRVEGGLKATPWATEPLLS